MRRAPLRPTVPPALAPLPFERGPALRRSGHDSTRSCGEVIRRPASSISVRNDGIGLPVAGRFLRGQRFAHVATAEVELFSRSA
jgi:hypothetical protein